MKNTSNTTKWLIAGAAGLVVVVLGCCTLVGGVVLFNRISGNLPIRQTAVSIQPGEPVQVPTDLEPTEEEQPTLAPSETLAPESPTKEALPSPVPTKAEATAAPTAQLNQIDYEGVHFSIDPSLADSADPEIVDAVTGPDLAYWELAPQHKVFTLSGYPLVDTFHKPQIFVYPVQDYLTIVPTIAEPLANLQLMLIRKSTAQLPSNLPFFMNWNAAQVLYTKVKFLDFKNGSGVRYLTQYGQGLYPINNTDMFYTFQGVTSDGKYLISAVLPVSNPILPDPETVIQDPKFMDQFGSYIVEIKDQLEAQTDASFQPDLALFDQLITSVEIK